MQSGGGEARIELVPCLELGGHVIDDSIVPIQPAEVDVAIGRQYLKARRRVADHGHVERASAQIVDHGQVRACIGFFDTPQFTPCPGVGEGGGRRFVEHPDDVQAGDAAGVLQVALAARTH